MVLHLRKLVVGIGDIQELVDVNRNRVIDYHGQAAIPVWTRHKPRREDELRGGSLYRIIKNRVQCRQQILGLETIIDDENGKYCLIMVDPEVIQTVSIAHRPFQGWRYFENADVPADRGVFRGEDSTQQGEEIPPEMEEELRQSGLL